jgi:hypothetical protein
VLKVASYVTNEPYVAIFNNNKQYNNSNNNNNNNNSNNKTPTVPSNLEPATTTITIMTLDLIGHWGEYMEVA